MQKKLRVLDIQPSLMQYRVPIHNIIAKHVDLTVAYIDKDVSTSECEFAKVHYPHRNVGPFQIPCRGANIDFDSYDVIITSPNLRVPESILLPLKPRKYKVIGWNIGIRASYTLNYDAGRKHTFADWIYGKLLSQFDANVFYMEEAKKFWKTGLLDNVFVAPNTTEVLPLRFFPENKKNLLFVGTLYAGKGLDKLIVALRDVVEETHSDIKLDIVGNGPERQSLEAMVERYGLKGNVLFHEGIYEEQKLANLYSSAIMCISPTQAGLSVPKSMGYGVPFVTRKDSITGGEIYHIHNGIDGIMYEEDSDLNDIIKDAITNPDKYIEMGRRAKEYYDQSATPQIMAEGVLLAIKSVI